MAPLKTTTTPLLSRLIPGTPVTVPLIAKTPIWILVGPSSSRVDPPTLLPVVLLLIMTTCRVFIRLAYENIIRLRSRWQLRCINPTTGYFFYSGSCPLVVGRN